jgi:hypothetical protein
MRLSMGKSAGRGVQGHNDQHDIINRPATYRETWLCVRVTVSVSRTPNYIRGTILDRRILIGLLSAPVELRQNQSYWNTH